MVTRAAPVFRHYLLRVSFHRSLLQGRPIGRQCLINDPPYLFLTIAPAGVSVLAPSRLVLVLAMMLPPVELALSRGGQARGQSLDGDSSAGRTSGRRVWRRLRGGVADRLAGGEAGDRLTGASRGLEYSAAEQHMVASPEAICQGPPPRAAARPSFVPGCLLRHLPGVQHGVGALGS